MGRKRNLNRDKAFELYKEKNGNIGSKEIGELLREETSKVTMWKSLDKWDVKLGIKKRKRGAPKSNKNSKGGKPGNINAFKHGDRIPPERFNDKSFLAKYLPKVTASIMNDISNSGISSLDILWSNIEIHYSAIIRSQKIMYVSSKSDITKELKKEKSYIDNNSQSGEQEYEIQFAWDKQERFLKAQSTAMKTIINLIKTYEELLNKNWNIATEEQKLRVDKLKAEINNLSNSSIDSNTPIKIEFIKASTINE